MTKNYNKSQRQEIIYQILRSRDEESAMSAKEIHEAILRELMDIDLRTIRRDLVELSESHGLCSIEGRPERFYLSKDFTMKYNLNLNEETLQVLLVALNNLKFTSHDYFNILAQEAETVIYQSLDKNVAAELRESKDRYYFDFGTSGKPACENSKDFKKIMQAIRESRIFHCINISPYKDDDYNKRVRKFAPLMMIFSAGVPYMVVKDLEDKKIKKLRATRVKNVKLVNNSFNGENLRKQINLNNFIGGWGGLGEEGIQIEIICDKQMYTYFKERVIHHSQTIKELNDNKYKISLECAPSFEIVRILASFGGHIYQIAPTEIMEQIIKVWEEGLEKAA